ncbi:MAG: hypothetical protein ACR2MP_30025 [Streptosporangiaceae bacterium]
MRDSTTAADIPVHGTDLVAGYINGTYAWTDEGFGRFPGIPHILIDIHGDNPHAGVLDVEPKCAPIEAAPPGRGRGAGFSRTPIRRSSMRTVRP